MKYVCDVCGWVYDEEEGAPDMGIAPGTKFEDLPEDFLCPLCSVGKELFSEVSEQKQVEENSNKKTEIGKLKWKNRNKKIQIGKQKQENRKKKNRR